jgi:16S rRNA (uracil1498-N3)-methyltransferase
VSPRAPHRFYFAGALTGAQAAVALSAEESHHLLRVLRLGCGARVELFDAEGRGWLAEVAGEHKGIASLRPVEPLAPRRPERFELNIAIAVLKRRPMDWLIEKLSELGVDTLQPLLTARTIGQGDFKSAGAPPERWERLTLAAAKQCGRNRPLALRAPAPLSDWLGQPFQGALGLVARLGEGLPSLAQSLAGRSDAREPVWVAIGPEGGWTPAEETAFAAAGFKPVRLGDLTLRAETAALAAAAACRVI